MCGFNRAKFAAKHTQDEWEEICKSGKFEEEIQKFCPKYKKGYLKKSQLKYIYDFAYEYASDSGNVPSCYNRMGLPPHCIKKIYALNKFGCKKLK